MKLPNEDLIKFVNSASSVLGKNLVTWVNLYGNKDTFKATIATQNGQAVFKTKVELSDSVFKTALPPSILLGLCKAKSTEIEYSKNQIKFKKNSNTGSLNTGEYSDVRISIPESTESSKIFEAASKTSLGVSYSGASLVAQIRTQGKQSTVLTGDGFHFAIYQSKKLGNFNLPVEYVGYCKSLFKGDVSVGCLDNFFVAWDDTTSIRLPMVEAESNVPFDQATDGNLLKNVKTSFVCDSADLIEKLDNVSLAYNSGEDRLVIQPEKGVVKFSVKSAVGTSQEVLKTSVKTNGQPIYLDPSNLYDLLNLSSGQVTVEFVERNGVNQICVIRTEDQVLYLVASSPE